MRNSCVVFCLFFSVLSVSSEKRSRIRFYSDDTNTTCLGIVCPRNFIFVPCTLGDGREDTCVGCPLDRPISIEKLNSALFSEPPDNICKDPDEICVCTDEAKLMNPEECLNNLNPKCQCDVSRGYIGSDPKLCKLSENPCSSTGFELALNGSCVKCSDEKYKDQIGYGKCEQQPKCEHPYVVNQQGDFRTKRTCKLQPTVNTPFPGKKTSVSNSVPTTDKGYKSIPTSSVTVNDTSTNSPPGKEPTSNEKWIILGITGFIVATVILGVNFYKVFRNRREDDCEEVTIVLCNRCGRKNLNHIELNDGGKDTDNNNKETDGLLQDSILNSRETGDKDDSYIVDDCADQLNTERNGDQDVLQTRRSSESGSSFIGTGNSGIPDISPFGAVPISDESCHSCRSDVKREKTKNDSQQTLPQATHRQPEIPSDALKNVDSVAINVIPNPGIKGDSVCESVKSKNASVQTVDNVLDSCEEPHDTGQLSQSPGNIVTHYNRSNSVDTDLKKEISSENTNVKESEQEPTSNVPNLHVDSMLSGENASPTVSSYIYRLCCRSSGEDRLSRGSIECCDGQQHCLKSRVLSEFVTGKVLLSVPFTMAHMTTFVVFVPDNEHDGAKPYIDIQMERLSNSLEIQSLLEPDSIILHLESFETINLQRPEENLAHWVHSISAQPNQMPLPHAQNQSDSGIDNNTGNDEEQNEGAYNSLCLRSFENDN